MNSCSRVLRNERCPRCAKLGKDTRGDNLAVYEDHSYCFSCGYVVRDLVSPASTSLSPTPPPTTVITTSSSALSLENASTTLSAPALLWLHRYDITRDEIRDNHIVYDHNRDILLYPIYDGDLLVSIHGRYFGTSEHHPRYLRTDFKKSHYKVFENTTKGLIYVLVEDYISAIKVGRSYNCIPLFGSFYPKQLVLSLVGRANVLRFWLDRDKATEAITYAAKARQFIPNTGTIISEKDPKEYDTQEIKDYVESSLGNNQGILKL